MRVTVSAVGMRLAGTARRGAGWQELLALFVHSSLKGHHHSHSTLPGDYMLMSHAREQQHEQMAREDDASAPTSQHGPTSDDVTFDAFFRRHEKALYGYLRRLLPTDDVAVEVAQEAFFRAWTHFEDIRVYERPEAWLYRVATNLAISQLRRRKPLSFTHVFRRAGQETESGDGAEDELLTDSLDMEGDLVTRDLINRTLLRLPERQRAVLLLRIVHGFSCEEAAELLETSVANVRQMLSRGRERFRTLYSAAAGESEPIE